jgi:VIT1/CCC1 family predicted Fe2+/Mn2+ transporter
MARLQILPDEHDASPKIMHHMNNPNFKVMKCSSKYYLKSTYIFNQSLSTVLVPILPFLSNEFLSDGVRLSIVIVVVVIVIDVF